MTERDTEKIKAEGMCVHGNFPATCKQCLTNDQLPETEEKPSELEREFSELTESKEFLEAIRQFPDEARDVAVGLGVEYFMFDKNWDNLRDYLQDLREKLGTNPGFFDIDKITDERASLIVKRLAETLGIDSESEEGKEKLFRYLSDAYEKEGYLYHGFNGAFRDAVSEHGLQPEMRTWDWDDLQSISQLLTRVGLSMGLGWANINSKSKISLGDDPKNVYRYALASPEWFSQFVASGFHILLQPPYDKKAFYKKDYIAAQRNVEMLCDRLMHQSKEDEVATGRAYPNMTQAEKEIVLAFFEKHWQEFCTEKSTPSLALVKKSAVGRDKTPYTSYGDWAARMKGFGQNDVSIDRYAKTLLYTRDQDLQVDHAIGPEEMIIINLPKYTDVHAA